MKTALHKILMQEALKEAAVAFDKDEVPVGAVIAHEKEGIIARAHNQIKMLKDPTAHAEMIAITQAAAYLKNERLNGCSLYVTIEPCPMCVGAAVLARLKNIYFGAADPKAGACGSVLDLANNGRLNHRIKVVKGVLEEDCRELIQRFFKTKRIQSDTN